MTYKSDNRYTLDLIRSLALGISTAGCLGSLALTMQTGQRNVSFVLKLFLSAWVLSPFISIIISCVISKKWFSRTRLLLYILTVIISILTLLFYGGELSFSGSKPSFVFLVTPLVSWTIMLSAYYLFKR